MRSNTLSWISNFFRYTLLTGASLYIIIYIVVVFFRIQYPFELEWEEGASVDHVRWILSGHKYYVSPSLEFVPSLYTPVFFYVTAILSKVIGVGFMPLRIVSFISSIGSFLIIYLIVKRETGDTFSGILASCLFAATFHLSGSWFDIGRVDSLFLFLLLFGIYLLRFKTSSISPVLAGIFLSLSFFTKQTAFVISIPIMLYCILSDRRSLFLSIIPLIFIVGVGSVLLNYYYDGWFNFYVFELPRTTPIDSRPISHFLIKDIFLPFYIALFMAIFYLISQLLKSKRQNFFFYFLLAAGMLGSSLFSRHRSGGWFNVMLPAYAIISILFGLGVNKLLEISQSLSANKKDLMKIVLYLLCILQFASGNLIYNPLDRIPTKQDREAGWKLIDKIANIEGEVFIPYHGYLNTFINKKSYAHQMGMRDVITTNSEKHAHIKSKLIDEIRDAMRTQKFSAIIISSPESWYPPDMEKYYIKKEKIFNGEDVFYPVTGMRTRPEFVYVPKENTGNSNLGS